MIKTKSLTEEFDCLTHYLANRNAAFEAKCKEEGATFWCANVLTANELACMGVYTVEQYERMSAEQDALEAAKEDRKNSY